MPNLERTDVHSPSRINPEDYRYVGQEAIRIEGLGDCFFIQAERARIQADMARTGGTYSTHEHGGNCMVCGSVNAIYTVLFHHAPSNAYVRMGQDCAQKADMGDPEAFKAFRTAVEAARGARAGKLKAQGLLQERGLEAAWTVYQAGATSRDETIVVDIVGKLVQYGSASDKQYSFLANLLRRIENRPAIEAQRAAENAAAAPVPTGRVQVTGLVLSTKSVASGFRYGAEVIKLVVKDDSGFKVYGTAADSLMSGNAPLKGQRVTFKATLEPSKDDPKFGFFKRPTGARLLAEEGAQAPSGQAFPTYDTVAVPAGQTEYSNAEIGEALEVSDEPLVEAVA